MTALPVLRPLAIVGLSLLLGVLVSTAPASDYPWLDGSVQHSLATAIDPPAGYHRVDVANGSFAAWLRGLPLRAGRPQVHLFDGRLKTNQSAHYAVVDIDTGDRDLQQCADAVIRLRGEYLFATGASNAIRFHFTSGDVAAWTDWAAGMRPVVQGTDVSWSRRAAPDATHATFRRYLDTVFMYAGSASLERELQPVTDPSAIEAGDVFIHGGSPGHAVLVVDVAVDAAGRRMFAIAQSYMPAQEIHVLRNPGGASPWYPARASGDLVTPEWRFDYTELRRFTGIDRRP